MFFVLYFHLRVCVLASAFMRNKLHSGVGICIDLQKAFDAVNHRILLKKLDRCGIRGIMFDWIQDYLSNRQ